VINKTSTKSAKSEVFGNSRECENARQRETSPMPGPSLWVQHTDQDFFGAPTGIGLKSTGLRLKGTLENHRLAAFWAKAF